MPDDHKPAEPGPGQAGRRAFLTLAGVVAAAVPVSPFLAACESGRSPSGTAAPAGRSAGSTVAAPCAPSPCAGLGAGTAPALTDWHTLRRSLSTKELIQPGQGGYTTARELFDPRFDAIEPAGIAYCRTPQDVSACLMAQINSRMTNLVRAPRVSLKPDCSPACGAKQGIWPGSTTTIRPQRRSRQSVRFPGKGSRSGVTQYDATSARHQA